MAKLRLSDINSAVKPIGAVTIRLSLFGPKDKKGNGNNEGRTAILRAVATLTVVIPAIATLSCHSGSENALSETTPTNADHAKVTLDHRPAFKDDSLL